MKHADIFITHNITNPCRKAGQAAYVYVIHMDTSKGIATCGEFGTGQDMTVNRINLLALRSALKHFHKPAEITIYTDSATVAGAFNCDNIKVWQKNGFKTAHGKPLANADLWRSVSDLAKKHLVDAIQTRNHPYTSWAETELLRKYGKA